MLSTKIFKRHVPYICSNNRYYTREEIVAKKQARAVAFTKISSQSKEGQWCDDATVRRRFYSGGNFTMRLLWSHFKPPRYEVPVVALVLLTLMACRAPSIVEAAGFAASPQDHHAPAPTPLDIITIGGGIVGLATSVALLERNPSLNIRVYERANALLPMGALLGLFPNGQTALRHISPSVWERIEASSLPCTGVQQRNINGDLIRTREIGAGALYLVWFMLQQELRQALPDDVVCLASEFVDYQLHSNDDLISVRILNRNTQEMEMKTCRVLIGADGIHSKVRRRLAIETKQTPVLRFQSRVMHRAVLHMGSIDPRYRPPPGVTVSNSCGEPGKTFALGETAKGIVTFTSTLATNSPIEEKSVPDAIKRRLETWFEGYPEDVRHILDIVPVSAIHENSVFDMDVLKKWNNGPVVLLGDAAHAMTPALGQGGNVGLEDAAELTSILSPLFSTLSRPDGQEVAQALQKFCDIRKERVRSIHFASREHSRARHGRDKDRYARNSKFNDWMWKWVPSTMQPADK